MPRPPWEGHLAWVPPLGREGTAKALPSLLLNASSPDCGVKARLGCGCRRGLMQPSPSRRHGRVFCSFPAAGGPWARERLQLIDVSTKAPLHSRGLHWDHYSLGEATYWETKARTSELDTLGALQCRAMAMKTAIPSIPTPSRPAPGTWNAVSVPGEG